MEPIPAATPGQQSSAAGRPLRSNSPEPRGPSAASGSVRRRSVARNTLLNVIGHGSPLLVALFAIPILTAQLGTDRFGILTLAWVVLGYFSLFDLGLGRALTVFVAERLGRGDEEEIPALAWTSLSLMLVLGGCGMLLALALSPWVVLSVLNVPAGLQTDALHSFYLLATSIPIVITTAGFRGILEARERFDLINAIRAPLGVFTFAGPVLVLPFSTNLVPIVAVLVAGRVIGWAVHMVLAVRALPRLRRRPWLRRELISPLFRFGAWMTVTNIVGPLMVSLDRFVIGATISMSAVAFYTAPYEAVTKLWIFPMALAGALFPAFASTFARASADAARLYGRAVRSTLIIIFPVTLAVIAFAREGLSLWLGTAFAVQSTLVLQWLTVGVLFNSVAQIPFTLVQGAGRPDLTAKLHVIELPLYLGFLSWLIAAYGITGAAVAWAARCAVDAVALFVLAHSLLPHSAKHLRHGFPAAVLFLVMLAVASQPMPIKIKALVFLAVFAVFLPVAWYGLLEVDERADVRVRLGRIGE